MEEVRAKRTTAHQTAGDLMYKNVTMDGNRFAKIMKEQVHPAVRRAFHWWKEVDPKLPVLLSSLLALVNPYSGWFALLS